MSQFGISVWPQNLTHRGYKGPLSHRFDAQLDAFVLDNDCVFLPAPPKTEEAYLELCAVDLDDIDAICKFVHRYGTLDLRHDHWGGIMDDSTGHGYYGFRLARGWPAVHAKLVDDRTSASAAAGPGTFGITPISEFRYGALCMRDLVTAARVTRGELERTSARWVSPVWDGPHESFETYPWTEPKDDQSVGGAESLLEIYLTDGLAAFHPRVWTRDTREEVVFDIPLWQTMCLELFNHLAASAPYRVCASETCGRLFVQQSGRSRHGQHRAEGVKYCSSSCARAQANRMYRRRQRIATQKASAD